MNCDNCGHSIGNHVGYTYMGGGHGEVLGCTFVTDLEKQELCDCENSPEDIEEQGVDGE